MLYPMVVSFGMFGLWGKMCAFPRPFYSYRQVNRLCSFCDYSERKRLDRSARLQVKGNAPFFIRGSGRIAVVDGDLLDNGKA